MKSYNAVMILIVLAVDIGVVNDRHFLAGILYLCCFARLIGEDLSNKNK